MASLSRLQTITRSLKRNPLPHSPTKLFNPRETIRHASSSRAIASPRCFTSVPGNWQLQTRRTLILESATSASESVKLSRLSDSDSGIVEVCLDRPGAKNAIGRDMLRGLQNAFEAVREDASANVLMICSGVPRVFCAGADLKERKTMSPSEVQLFVNLLRLTFSSLEDLHIPTIAVIEGVALGGGLELALSCDLRICGDDAVLGLPETGLAIIPGAGGTQRLPRIVGKSLAKELIYTGRRVGGKDAKSMGLVNHSVASGEAHLKALEIARDINQKLTTHRGPQTRRLIKDQSAEGLIGNHRIMPQRYSNEKLLRMFIQNFKEPSCYLYRKRDIGPVALKMAKRAINKGLELDMVSALELEEDCYKQTMNTKDRLEGLAAFAEKRKPRYTGQ